MNLHRLAPLLLALGTVASAPAHADLRFYVPFVKIAGAPGGPEGMAPGTVYVGVQSGHDLPMDLFPSPPVTYPTVGSGEVTFDSATDWIIDFRGGEAWAGSVSSIFVIDEALSDAQIESIRGGGADAILAFATPVPEPGTYALMLAGLGLVGAAAAGLRPATRGAINAPGAADPARRPPAPAGRGTR